MAEAWTLPGIAMDRAPTRRRNALDGARGLAGVAAALALWAWFVAGVVAPLGGAVARMRDEAARRASPVTCRVPADALASAARSSVERCR